MFKKLVLSTALASVLMVGCTTTTPSSTAIHEVQNTPVKPVKLVVPMTKIKPASNVKPKPPATLSPVVSMKGQDRAKLLACVDLVKHNIMRPDTIQPNLSKIKITTNKKRMTTVKMPFSALSMKNEGRDDFMVATCKFPKTGEGSVTMASI